MGKILPGKWDDFNAAFADAMAKRGEISGLKNHWLARDQNDPDAGFSITLWETEEDILQFWDGDKRKEAMAPLEPFFVNQFTTTHCEVTYSLKS